MLFHIPNGLYWPYLLLFYLFEMGMVFFLYRFMLCLGTKRSVAFLCSTLLLLLFQNNWGWCVLLEIPFLFFGMLSSWLILEWKDKPIVLYLLVGVFSACSFLSKQFGLGFLVLGLYELIFIAHKGWKHTLFYLVGYILPIMLCVVLWRWPFVESVLLNGYGTTSAKAIGRDITLIVKVKYIIKAVLLFLKRNPIVILSVLFLYESYKQHRLPNILFAYFGIGGFALQFYFVEAWSHYHLPLVLFSMIVMAELLTLDSVKILTMLKYAVIIYTLCVSIYFNINRIRRGWDERNSQYELANSVKKHIGQDKTLYIVHGFAHYYVYFMADIMPPNLKTIGYSFGPLGLNEEKCRRQIDSADYVLRYSDDYEYEAEFTPNLKKYVERFPIVGYWQDSTVVLHKMR